MKQKRLNLILLFIIASQALISQDLSKDYQPLKSSGTIPEVFFLSPRLQSESEIKSIEAEYDLKEKKDFITANNYFIHGLLLSGQVLINDPITQYVNKVAAKLVENNPSLSSTPLHVFVTKSPEVNAYAFDKGYIFVNLGLLAQLENEAQLAYILSHELTHIKKKHSVKGYIANKRYRNQSYDKYSKEDNILANYRFSKDQEREADLEGLALIKNTNYSAKAVMGAFDVMQYSYLPFELPEFKKSFLEDDFLKIPDTLNLKVTAGIKSNEDYDDSKSSHPNIRKRRLSIEEDLKTISETGRKRYLISEEEFKKIRELSRFELCRIYILKKDYINAIYSAYILLQKYPDNLYLKKIVCKALYNILISKDGSYVSQKVTEKISIGGGGEGSYSVEDYEKIEGASQRLYYLFDRLTSRELNVIALSYTYKQAKHHPSDNTLSSLTDSLFSFLVNENNLYPDSFSKKTLKELTDSTKESSSVIDTTLKLTVEEPVEESKYTEIRKNLIRVSMDKSPEQTKTDDSDFIRYAFVGLLKEEEFLRRFRRAANDKSKESVEEYTNDKSSKREKREKEKLLGIGKIIFLDPLYEVATEKKHEIKIQYQKSEDKKLKLVEIQKKCSEKLNLQYEMISSIGLTPTDIERYNENAVINEWFSERFKNGNTSDEMMDCSEDLKEIIKRRGAKYIALNGILNIDKKYSAYVFLLLDLETGRIVRYENVTVKSKDSKDLLTSYVYNSLYYVVNK